MAEIVTLCSCYIIVARNLTVFISNLLNAWGQKKLDTNLKKKEPILMPLVS